MQIALVDPFGSLIWLFLKVEKVQQRSFVWKVLLSYEFSGYSNQQFEERVLKSCPPFFPPNNSCDAKK